MRNQFEPAKLPTFEPLKPLTLPNLNQPETQSVPAKQSFQEFAMAGGGVPAQYKGREHVWHAKVGKHEVSMKKGGDPLDEFVPPRFRSAGRRPAGQNDRKASASMPVDFARGAISGALGAPGDIESLVRMLPGFDEKTFLPTSEDIEKRLPFRSDTPQGRMASGLGTLAGGFYTGPGSPFNVAAKGAKLAGEGLGQLKGSGAGAKGLAGQRGVIKMPGGNFLTGRVEKDVKGLKPHDSPTPEDKAWIKEKREELLASPESEQRTRGLRAVDADIAVQNRNEALNKWVDSNLSNYIKKQMATPDDPIRALAEQGITHKKGLDPALNYGSLREQREKAGFSGEGMGQSPLAKTWEQAADEAIATHRAGDIQDMPARFTKSEEAQAKMIAARDELDKKFIEHLKKAGLNDREVDSLVRGNTYPEKAKMVGNTAFLQANDEYRAAQSPMMNSYMELGRQNPWISKVDPETTIYSPYTSDLGFDHIMDVLRQDLAAGRIRPEQMNKISISDAVRRTHQFDEDMAKKMAEAQIKATEGMPVHKDYGDKGYKWIELAPAKMPENWAAPEKFSIVSPTPGSETLAIMDNETGKYITTGLKSQEEALKHLHRTVNKDAVENALKYEGETMGHCVGGYCPDVLEGRSRIFSLRSAKGEPHVTVEVQPDPHYGNRAAEMKRAGASDEEIAAFFENPPQKIVQIKGKQNRAPKEEYLPYVQDFVKGGKWADVGDLANTGLYSAKDVDRIMPEGVQMSRNARTLALGRARRAGELPEYMTRQEYEAMIQKHVPEDIWAAEKAQRAAEDDELLRQLRPPEEGMAHGGEVHMAGGGLLKSGLKKLAQMAGEVPAGVEPITVKTKAAPLERAPAKSKEEIEAIAQRIAPQLTGEFVRGKVGTQSVAGKTRKQFEREKDLPLDIRPTKGEGLANPEKLDYEKLKGSVFMGIPGDTSITGKSIHGVGDIRMESPSPQHGGPMYGYGKEDPTFWASGINAARRVQNLGREIQGQYDAPVLGKYIMMGPEGLPYAQHFADANLQAIDLSKMSKRQIEQFNKLLREGSPKSGPRPSFPGIQDKNEAYLHFAFDPELRKHFNQLMEMPTVTNKLNLPSGQDVRFAVTEPELRNLETGVTGKSVGRMRPDIEDLQLSAHPTYTHDIPGEFMGSSAYPVPYELSFPDSLRAVRANPKQAPQEFGSLKMVGARQIIDQQMIDEIKQYEEAMKRLTGKKKGGAVSGLSAATKSCSCDD